MVDETRQEEQERTEETDFSSAFKDAMDKVPGHTEPSADELRSHEQEDTSENEDDSTDVEDTSSGETEDGENEKDPNEEIAKQYSSDGTDYKTLYEEEVEAHNKEKQRNSSWEGRISAANKKAKAAEDRADSLENELAKAKENTSDFKLEFEGDEAKELMNEFNTEYPDLKKAIIHIASAVAKEIALDYITQYMPDVKPLEKRVEQLADEVEEDAREKHLRLITEAHPDQKMIISKGYLKNWILNQPSYKQPSLVKAYEQGNTQDVIDLIQDFKDSTGWTTAIKNSQRKEPTNTPKSNDKDSKLQQQMAVSSEHTPLEPGKEATDSEDFSSAFAERASQSTRK